jgi:hypothetical protein
MDKATEYLNSYAASLKFSKLPQEAVLLVARGNTVLLQIMGWSGNVRDHLFSRKPRP